jgi:hypothetical protein
MANMKKPAMKKPTVSRAPAKKVPSGMKVNMPKVTGAKPGVKKPMPKVTGVKPSTRVQMPLTGPAAITAIQKRTSPSGVKKAEAGAKKAIDKKYPGLYKSGK